MTIQNERDLEKKIKGLRKVVMSGAGSCLGDLKGASYLVEEKTSERSVSITEKLLKTVEYKARRELREPLIILNIAGRRLVLFWIQ